LSFYDWGDGSVTPIRQPGWTEYLFVWHLVQSLPVPL
jgi:hypothetical protein